MAIVGAGYLYDLLSPGNFTRKINNAKEILADVKFDAIVGSGNSGALFGGALSIALQKPFILVRKDIDLQHSHSAYIVEGDDMINSYIFVDDLIFTGQTLDRVLTKMKSHAPKAQFIGVYTYSGGGVFTKPENCSIYEKWQKQQEKNA